MGLILYHDEVELCNPLDSKAGKHKMDMYYYTLTNIPPQYRSKRSAVRLVGIVNAKYVKKYGIDKILSPLLRDLTELYNGVVFDYDDKQLTVFGKVVLCVGDTLGQHLWGGFKEGVGGSFQKCRNCYCIFEQMHEHFCESFFELRSKESYDEECTQIERASSIPLIKDLRRIYGLNQRSPLCQSPGFNVTSQLPQDVMHTLLEGVVQYELRLVILYFLNNGNFTLNDLNTVIFSHNFGYSEISDKPGPLKDTVFVNDNYKLKYSAAQARIFLRLVPFFLSKLNVEWDNEYYQFVTELVQINQIVFSPVINSSTIQHLAQLIEDHLSRFKVLFPEQNILPKGHYCIHLPNMIKKCGPLIRSSCFSFESANCYFKKIALKQNFKNISQSLAKRCQLLDCVHFGNGDSHPIFSTERKVGKLSKLLDEQKLEVRNAMDKFGLLPSIDISIAFSASWIILLGTKYCKGAIVAAFATSDRLLPTFGVIENIFVVSDFVYFDLKLFSTMHFEQCLQAYNVEEVTNEDNQFICSYESLVDYNVFHIIEFNNSLYISVKYDIDDLVEEHYKGHNYFF